MAANCGRQLGRGKTKNSVLTPIRVDAMIAIELGRTRNRSHAELNKGASHEATTAQTCGVQVQQAEVD